MRALKWATPGGSVASSKVPVTSELSSEHRAGAAVSGSNPIPPNSRDDDGGPSGKGPWWSEAAQEVTGHGTKPFGDGVRSIGSNQYSNLFPEHEPNNGKVIPTNVLHRKTGTFIYVVMNDGTLYVGKHKWENTHIDYSGGANVLAAGEVKLKDGNIVEINNRSGHYKPSGNSARSAAEMAFERAGFDPWGKYADKEFPD